MTVLAVKGLTYSFGKQTVLDNISFTLEKGDIAGLIGNNGAGKTTLMKLVSGILAGPKDIIDLKTRTVGALIEAPALYPNMTVEANLKFYCKLYSKDYALIDRYKDELEVAAYLKRKASTGKVTLSLVVEGGGEDLDERAGHIEQAAFAAARRVGAVEAAPRLWFTEVVDVGFAGSLIFTMASGDDATPAKDAVLRAIAPLTRQ